MLTVLIPAAGFGKRNPDAPIKELMLANDRHLIDYTFDHLAVSGAKERIEKIVIITRETKLLSLRNWYEKWQKVNDPLPVFFSTFEPQKTDEWPMTIFSSHKFWGTKNLVLLPDTHLMLRDRKSLVASFDDALTFYETVWTLASIESTKAITYGVVDKARLSLTEKPLQLNEGTTQIWGCFGFQSRIGANLLRELQHSTENHSPFSLPSQSTFLDLEIFTDLSR